MLLLLVSLTSICFWVSLKDSLLIKGLPNTLWSAGDLSLSTLLITLTLLILIGSAPFFFILGASAVALLSLSWSHWIVSFLSVFFDKGSFFGGSLHLTLMVIIFNVFIITLRPVTLTLRVFINVSLGHFIINLSHTLSWPLSFLWAVEEFVYVVQSFVFLTLVISYLDSL